MLASSTSFSYWAGPGRRRRYLAILLGWGLGLHATAGRAQSTALPVGTPGLAVDYYRGYFNDDLSFFTTTTPAVVGRPVEQLDFEEAETDNFAVGSVATYYSPGRPDEFSGRFQGQLYITTAGQYTFYLGSDDAAYLWLDNGALPVAANHGDTYPFRETTGTLTLTPGLHTLRVDYGEHGGSQGLVLSYSGPAMPKQLVPNGVLYSQPTAALSPTLAAFGAVATAQQQVALGWQTTSEENSRAFVVQHSVDGMVFTELLRQPGAASATGPHSYAALDAQPTTGLHFYRLQQLRSDRAPVYSPVVAVAVGAVPASISAYPLPNDGTFLLQAPAASSGAALLQLADMSGRRVFSQSLQLSAGAAQKIAPGLPTGVYLLRLTTGTATFRQKISLGF